MHLSPHACSHTRGAACLCVHPPHPGMLRHRYTWILCRAVSSPPRLLPTGICSPKCIPHACTRHTQPTCRLPSIRFCHGCAAHFRTWVQVSALLVPGLSPPQCTLALPPGGPSLVCTSSGHSTLSQTKHNRDRKQDGEVVQPRLPSCAGTPALAARMEQNPASPCVGREGRCSPDRL